MTVYAKKAREIIKESIKSAIFIDEKALMPFQNPSDPELPEEVLTKELYSNFKSNSISLDIHKFQRGDETGKFEDYFFSGRDLVLLDWKLAGRDGEEYALKLLAAVVNKLHIHFCVIYTSENNFDVIINNILSYFSGKKKEDYVAIKQDTAKFFDEEDDPILQNVSIDDPNRNNALVSQIDGKHIPQIIASTGDRKLTQALIKIRFAYESWHKSEIALPCPEIVDRSSKIIVIQNTIITILNKTANNPSVLINNLSDQVAKSKNSFFQLLGLNMQNVFEKKGAFISANLLNISKDAFLSHGKKLEKYKLPFEPFIKEVLLEQVRLNLREEKLSILDETFLRKISNGIKKSTNEEICTINTFYNGAKLQGDRNLNFGDIFISSSGVYLLSITALCDCLYPENIKNQYYFVKASEILDLKKAFKKGDSGFISYADGKCINWATNEGFVKPVQIFVRNPIITNNEINIDYITTSGTKNEKLTYIFTLKQNYAQRIANQAFSHPVRVGVDFAKV